MSPNRNSPRNRPISKITIHHFAGHATARNVGNLLADPSRQASYNYGVDLNETVLYVDERNRSWASSSPANDHQAVTIGVANSTLAPTWEVDSRTWTRMIDLTVDIIRRNLGITRRDGRPGLFFDGTQNGSLTFHDMFTNTTCPGPFIRNRAQQICDEVNARLDGLTSNNTVVVPPTPTPESPVHVVRAGESLSVIANQHRTTVNELVRLNNIANPNLIRVDQLIKLPTENNVVTDQNSVVNTSNTSNPAQNMSNPHLNIQVGSRV